MKKTLLISMLVFFGFAVNAQTPETIYEQNFDALTPGQGVAAQLDEWTTWNNNPGSTEDGLISNEQASSPSNSLKITTGNDNIYNLGSKTSGVYTINFKYMVAEGSGAYYNVEHIFGSKWAFEVFFRNDGTGYVSANGAQTEFTFTNGQWIDIENIIDLGGNATIKMNGAEIHSWPYNTLPDGTTTDPKLDVVNFYAGTVQNAPYPSLYFVDDFEYILLEEGAMPPTIDVDLSTIEATDNDNVVLTINNTGEGALSYSAYPVYPQNTKANYVENAEETTQTIMLQHVNPNHLQATQQTAENKTPLNLNRDEVLTHIQSQFAGGFGYDSEVTAKVAAHFRPQDLKNYIGMKVSAVRIGINNLPAANSTNMMIWERGGFITPKPGNTLVNTAFTPIEATEVMIPVSEDIYIDGKDLWIGYSATDLGAECYPFGLDEGPQVPNVNYISSGPGWSTISEDFGNLFILADLTGTASPNYLTIMPESGEVPAGGNAQLMLSFSTAGLAIGTYNSELHIASTDVEHEFTVIPVQLNVTIGTDDVEKVGVMTFPNPTTEQINVKANSAINTIKVINQVGQVVASYNVSGRTQYAINASNLENGVYMIQVELNNNETITNKVMVK